MAFPDTDINNAPDYIKPFVTQPAPSGVAELLSDGSWCGHGEELYRVYDIIENGNLNFQIKLPDMVIDELFPTAIRATSVRNQKEFLIYDTRQHPASWYAVEDNAKNETKFHTHHSCEKCGGVIFKLSVGFEIPVDSSSPDDTSWFALATECTQCGDRTISFEDETA